MGFSAPLWGCGEVAVTPERAVGQAEPGKGQAGGLYGCIWPGTLLTPWGWGPRHPARL